MTEQYPLSEARKDYALRAEVGAKPKFHKGKYGIKYDYYTCGKCGCRLKDIVDNYCWNCGFQILWAHPRCLTRYTESENSPD